MLQTAVRWRRRPTKGPGDGAAAASLSERGEHGVGRGARLMTKPRRTRHEAHDETSSYACRKPVGPSRPLCARSGRIPSLRSESCDASQPGTIQRFGGYRLWTHSTALNESAHARVRRKRRHASEARARKSGKRKSSGTKRREGNTSEACMKADEETLHQRQEREEDEIWQTNNKHTHGT